MYAFNHGALKLWARLMAQQESGDLPSPLNEAELVLLSEPVALNPNMTASGLPVPSFPGYAPKSLTAVTVQIVRIATGIWAIQLPLETFTCTDAETPDIQIYGWAVKFYLESGQPQPVFVEVWDAPQTITQESLSIILAPQIKMAWSVN